MLRFLSQPTAIDLSPQIRALNEPVGSGEFWALEIDKFYGQNAFAYAIRYDPAVRSHVGGKVEINRGLLKPQQFHDATFEESTLKFQSIKHRNEFLKQFETVDPNNNARNLEFLENFLTKMTTQFEGNPPVLATIPLRLTELITEMKRWEQHADGVVKTSKGWETVTKVDALFAKYDQEHR
ncbi:uncharacterized protein C8R40DRAFT_1175167 [Lentinula edodes]|uniref:uncharacterized protein n=1 Tax=Lentinula edodes TaxID=5353 RepID=UPI001E8CE8F3|nr:uncharacterized protein C8R40DRAFT_1175167 [Lentinula edodes]KAH7870934.1 hypothetical protein C8R40DRAFT_1175167 [Lentinula edodes]